MNNFWTWPEQNLNYFVNKLRRSTAWMKYLKEKGEEVLENLWSSAGLQNYFSGVAILLTKVSYQQELVVNKRCLWTHCYLLHWKLLPKSVQEWKLYYPGWQFMTHLLFSIFGWDHLQLGSWSEGWLKPLKLSREGVLGSKNLFNKSWQERPNT